MTCLPFGGAQKGNEEAVYRISFMLLLLTLILLPGCIGVSGDVSPHGEINRKWSSPFRLTVLLPSAVPKITTSSQEQVRFEARC